MRSKWLRRWSLRSALLCLPLTLAVTGAAGQGTPAEARLRALAEAAMRAESRTIMSGNLDTALQGMPEAEDIRGAMERPAAVARARNEANKQGGITVVRTTERLDPGKVQVSGGTATLETDVVLERHMSPQQGRPDKWVESRRYRFHYEQQNGANWRLVRYEEVDPFGMNRTEPAPGAPWPEPIRDPSANTNPAQRRGRPKGPGQTQGGTQGPSLFSYAAYSTLPRAAGTYRAYDPEAARRYARVYACPYGTACYPKGNDTYRWYGDTNTDGGDCTNFVSQALRAGGWAHISGSYADRASTNVWWYDSFAQSYTWVGAHYFYQFMKTHYDRGELAPNVWDMIVGDVLQADWQGDGRIDHTMFVSWLYYTTDSNQIYLSYHTPNTLDRPLSDVLAENPNARYYGWWIWS